MESIYLLIQDQIQLLNGEPSKARRRKADSALAELARTPSKTGHSYLHSIFKSGNSLDFLDRLTNCKKIMESYKSEPNIRAIIENTQIFENPSFGVYDKLW